MGPSERSIPVLLIESSADQALLTRRALYASHCSPCGVYPTAREALPALAQGAPEIVFLDGEALRLDPRSVALLRTEPKAAAVPVVVLSGRPGPGFAAEAQRAGANQFVPKPVAYEAFADTIRSVCAFWSGEGPAPVGSRWLA